jgi:hypothetical protein
MADNEKNTKSWSTYGVYNSYEEANNTKQLIVEKFDLIKIKRSRQGGFEYKLKTWSAPSAAKPLKKKKRKNVN